MNFLSMNGRIFWSDRLVGSWVGDQLVYCKLFEKLFENFPRFAATVTVKLSDGQIVEETSDKMNSKKEAEFQAAERAMAVVSRGQ